MDCERNPSLAPLLKHSNNMKPTNKLLLALCVLLTTTAIFAQTNLFPTTGSAGIGTTDPNPSALLDMVSTSKGILVPRMTKVQRDAIASPATGLLIYQTNVNPGFFYFNGTTWTAISSQDASKSLNNLTTTAVNINLQPGTDNTIDLGSAAQSWKNLYVDGIGYLGTAKLGNYVGTPEAGMIRWNGTDFQGYNGISWTSLSGGGGGGGDVATDLSNLTSTSINVDLIPNIDGIHDLGSTTKSWDNLYIENQLFISSIPAFKLDGDASYPSIFIGPTDHDTFIGNDNIFIGRNTASAATTTAFNNIAIGAYAGTSNNDGDDNVFIGPSAGFANTSGRRNLSFGAGAGQLTTTGDENIFLGQAAGYGNITGNKNICIGSVTHSNTDIGGNDSLNVIVGNRAGSYNAGSETVLIGAFAGHGNTQNYNVYIGAHAGFSSVNGYDNVYIGRNAGYTQVDGYANTFVGENAGYNFGGSGTSSRYNVYMGTDAGYYTKGAYNTYIGSKCGDSYADNEQCVLMGYGTDVSSATITNAIAIGYFTSISQSNSIRLGNSSINKLGIGRNASAGSVMEFQATTAKLTTGGVWTDASDKRLKRNITELNKTEILDKINKLSVTEWNYIADDPNIKHIGPMAQDFYAAFGLGDDTTIAAMDKAGVALIGIQELSSKLASLNSVVETVTAENKLLQERIEKLENLISGNPTSSENSNAQYIILAEESDMPVLFQNKPNPFTGNTTINYYVPASAKSAILQIVNQQGLIISTIQLTTGSGNIEIDATQLNSGLLTYSLIVDEKIIATKQMMLTK